MAGPRDVAEVEWRLLTRYGQGRISLACLRRQLAGIKAAVPMGDGCGHG